MALTKPIGFICYNNSELVRDGYIEPTMAFEHDADDFNLNLLKRNRKGITYQVVRDDPADPEKITKVIEKRRLLPAEKIKIEIQFTKTLKNAVTPVIGPQGVPSSPVGSLIGNPLAGLSFGGITSGFTDFVYDIIDSDMQINERIKITQDILDTGIVEFDSFPVSVFGIVKEYQEELADDDAEEAFKKAHPQGRVETDSITKLRTGKVGLDFQEFPSTDPKNPAKQTDRIGQNSRGQYQGGPRKRIDGATNPKGQFGEIGIPFIVMVENAGDSGNPPEQEVIFLEGQENIFLEIIRDHRKLKFRGDNKDVSGLRYYPFKNREVDDITDHDIKINVNDLKLDDVIYITYCTSTKRRVRQAMRHKGIVGQGNRFGVAGWNLEIGSQMDVFDYQIRNWLVPAKVPEETASDNEFKITFNQYKSWKIKEEEFDEEIAEAKTTKVREAKEKEKKDYFDERFDELEAWRMSSVTTSRLEMQWAADYRGIVLMADRKPAVVVFPFSEIRDKEWFTNYVKGLDFIEKHKDPVTKKTVYDNLEIKIDDAYESLDRQAEAPTDIGSPANELLFDREKIPYYQPFATALQNVSLYRDEADSGEGIPSLDVVLSSLLADGSITGSSVSSSDFLGSSQASNFLSKIETAFASETWEADDLKYYDLSFSIYQWSIKSPTPFITCEDKYPIREFNYSCNTYDAGGGSGVWLTTSYIENSLFEWRPAGGFIESYWKMDTPYFCGEFGRKTRIYIEKVGGNSLDNFSWIYVDTRPDIPETISMDKNLFNGNSYLTFYDTNHLDSASLHVFSSSYISESFKFLDIDTDKNPSREFLDYTKDKDGDDITDEDLQEDRMKQIAYAQRIIGYNNILGDAPSFSNGKVITNDVSYACHKDLTDFWQTVDFLDGTNPSGESFELDFTDDIPRIKNIPREWAIRDIQIEFRMPTGKNLTTSQSYATLYFEDEDVSINNFLIDEIRGASIRNTQKIRFQLDCQYYHSETIQLLGEVWKEVDITSVKAAVSDNFDLNDVKVKNGQTSIVDDGLGRLAVFFADSLGGNISIALTYDEGRKWTIFRDIIRLTSSEIATFPVVYQDSITPTVHLFYILNDSFLMYRTVNLDRLNCEDVWVNYVPPDFYDETSDDDDDENKSSSLYDYTEDGKSLRRVTSYFALGDGEANYFTDQMETTDKIEKNNTATESSQSIRFDYTGDLEDMDDVYNGEVFGINIGQSGILRIFYAGEEGLTIKISTDNRRWEYLAKKLPLHKTYLTDDIKEEENPVVSNVQIARNYYNEDLVYLFYFYRGMLLLRVLPPSLMTVAVNGDGDKDDTLLRNFLQIDEKYTGYRPIFISGQIPEEVLALRVDELEEEIATKKEVESEIAIQFPYGLEDIKKFDANFALDTSTQVFAYTTDNGNIRVLYKDIFDNLNGAYINGETTTPEIFYIIKQELIK